MKDIEQDKLDERVELLRLCLGMDVLKATEYAQKLNDEKLIELINGIGTDLLGKGMKKPATFPENYYGRYYTIRNGRLKAESVWETIELDILECLGSDQGERIRQFLSYLLDQNNYEADFTTFKAKFIKFRNALDKLLGYGLIKKVTTKDTTKYCLYKELVPLIRKILASEIVTEMPVIRSDIAIQELEEVKKMEEEFDSYLKELLDDRLEETVEFGRNLSIGFIADYFKEMFGPTLYFDALLALAQQYAMTDTQVLNPEGGQAFRTGFHLALFGSTGTGKTFVVKNLMMGDEDKGVKAHGLVGLNRYCGGMTAANFIRVGEAYQEKRFNFVVTEFNDWFRYKGMVEPLKLALEQGKIRYETKTESVGPYKFSSFFTANYNVKIEGRAGYKVTIADPNFDAIEDRMLVRLHRMTRERLRELTRSQRELAMGKIKMRYAEQIRDHLVLAYAIQTEHELVKDKFKKKSIVIREEAYKKLEEATNLILDKIGSDQIRISPRIQKNALKLVSSFTLPSFFAQDGDRLEVQEEALNLALKFFVEEIAVRQRIEVDIEDICYRLGVSELARVVVKVSDIKEELKDKEDEERARLFGEKIDKELRFLKKEFISEKKYEEYVEKLKGIFGTKWDSLNKESQQFLITGEILLDVFEDIDGEKIDFAPVIVEYAKSLEQELMQRVFFGFRKHLKDSGLISNEDLYKVDLENLKLSPSERRSFEKTCEIFKGFLANQSELTLGNIWYILHNALKNYAERSILLVKFKEYLTDTNLAYCLLSKEFITGLQVFIEEYRNKAAHLSTISLERSRKCRAILLTESPKLLVTL